MTLWRTVSRSNRDRAVERQNMALFTPVGRARDLAAATMRQAILAISSGDTVLANDVLEQVQPESPDNTTATGAACTGLAVGLLDEWLSGRDQQVPAGLAQQVRLVAGHWFGERVATDILVLAGKGKAFRSLTRVIARQGGKHVLFGAALALAAAVQTWSVRDGTPVRTSPVTPSVDRLRRPAGSARLTGRQSRVTTCNGAHPPAGPDDIVVCRDGYVRENGSQVLISFGATSRALPARMSVKTGATCGSQCWPVPTSARLQVTHGRC